MPNMDLVRQLAQKNSELVRVQEQLADVESKLASWDVRRNQEVSIIKRRQRAAFDEQQEAQKQIIVSVLSNKKKGAEEIVNSAINKDKPQFVGHEQMVTVVDKMKQIMPDELVETYSCWKPTEFKDDKQAYKAYSFLDSFASTNGGGTLPTRMFNAITDMLADVTEQQGHAGIVALAIGVLPLLCMFIAPFVFPFIYVVIGIFGALNGILSHIALHNLFSVREYMSDAYDEDLFNHDKDELMQQVTEFLEAVRKEQFAKIDSHQFLLDTNVIDTCEEKYRLEKNKLLEQQENFAHLVTLIKEELKKIEETRKEEQEKDHAYAEKVRDQYFKQRSWEYKWMDKLVFDVGPNDVVEAIPWKKCNTIYTVKDAETLQNFMQLTIFQLMLGMHPNYAQQIVLDFKYLGGKVISMAGINQAIISVNYGEQPTVKLQSVHDDVKRRVTTILQSSQGIEDFNELMHTYGVPGEAYVIVHVCGLASITPQWLDLFRNGSKVGYFFKLYATLPEIKAIGKQIALEDFKEFWDVSEHMLPRSENSIRTLLSADK